MPMQRVLTSFLMYFNFWLKIKNLLKWRKIFRDFSLNGTKFWVYFIIDNKINSQKISKICDFMIIFER